MKPFLRQSRFHRSPWSVLGAFSLVIILARGGRDDITFEPNAKHSRDEATPVRKRSSAVNRTVRSHEAAMSAHGAVLGKKSHSNQSVHQGQSKGRPHRHHRHGLGEPNFTVQHLEKSRNGKAYLMNETDLIASVERNRTISKMDVILDLGGGTGATIGGTGNLELDRDLIRRMRYQDKGVMLLLLGVYFLVLAFSASFAYRQAQNDSRVKYYADQRFHDLVAQGRDLQEFLDVFAQAPKDTYLQVTGFVPQPDGAAGTVEWQGDSYKSAFSFSLDLSPWVVQMRSRDTAASAHCEFGTMLSLVDGVVAEDLEHLDYYINHNRNDLALLLVEKEVVWPDWEELATNIKLKIRQRGFKGIISIHRASATKVTVYKNVTWANFMHSRVTKILCALSVLGWFIYLPYMWLRCTSTVIRSRYKVDISIEHYWDMIADKLTADGFMDESDTGNSSHGRLTVGDSATSAPSLAQRIFWYNTQNTETLT